MKQPPLYLGDISTDVANIEDQENEVPILSKESVMMYSIMLDERVIKIKAAIMMEKPIAEPKNLPNLSLTLPLNGLMATPDNPAIPRTIPI